MNFRGESQLPRAAWFDPRRVRRGIGTKGSRYDRDNVPNLYLNERQPALNNNFQDNANPKWGAPSAQAVFEKFLK